MNERLKLIGPRCVSSEAEYLALWKEHAQPDLTPHGMALTGGLLADRMSWAFLAGYQAAISWCFEQSPQLQEKSGWSAFASSEDRKPEDPLPGVIGTRSENSVVLSGNKTWIAACDSIESLVVKIGTGKSASYWYVPANTRGLSVIAYAEPKRLPEMSQGLAAFDKVKLLKSTELASSRVRLFQVAEAYHLLVALSASLWSQYTHSKFTDLADDCIGHLTDLKELSDSLQEETFKPQFSKMHERVLKTLKIFIDRADRSQSELWLRDLPILMMYASN